MKNFLTKVKNALDKEAFSINLGAGSSVSQIHSCGSNIVNINGISLEVSDGMIRLYTDNKPYKIIIDGEIIRR